MPFEIAADFVLADVVGDAAVGYAAADLGAAAFADTAVGVGEYAAGATAADIGGGFAADTALTAATDGGLSFAAADGVGNLAASSGFDWGALGSKALTSGVTALGTGVVQAALSPSLKPMQMQPPAVVAPPQPAQAPSAQAMRQQTGAAVAGQGQDSTLLTGLQGVSTDQYNLGRNTLLGA